MDSEKILGDALRLQRILLNSKLVSPSIGKPRQRLRSDLVEEKGQENHCDVTKRNVAENLHSAPLLQEVQSIRLPTIQLGFLLSTP